MKFMNWVDLEVWKPPEDVYVLVVRNDDSPHVKMSFVEIAYRTGDSFYDGLNAEDITRNGKYGRVTHWMFLPEPPSKTEKAIQE